MGVSAKEIRMYNSPPPHPVKFLTLFLFSCLCVQWRSWARAPLSQIFFMQFLAEIKPNNRLAPPPPGLAFPFGKSWTRHWYVCTRVIFVLFNNLVQQNWT